MPIRVSIVEDDAETREILSGWLDQATDFECVSKHSTAESAFKSLIPNNPEVVLMDINLPGVNGVECVRQLKPSLPDTQFVILTVYEDMEHIFNALQAGASGYLLKQTPRMELLDALRDVYKGGSPMTSSIARKVVRSFQQKTSADREMDDLSTREREVLDLLARGYLYKEIADKLEIAVPTVNTYIRRIYEKLHVRSRAQAVAKYTYLPPSPGTE